MVQTPPPTRTDRYSRAAVRGVGGARGGRTQTYRITGAAQDAVLEEAATLAKDRTGLPAEAEKYRRKKKTIDCGDGGKINIREDRTSSSHNEAMT